MRKIKSSEITPEQLYISRRQFMKAAGALTAGSIWLAACKANERSSATGGGSVSTSEAGTTAVNSILLSDELGDPANSFEDITHYNNYYEFTTSKTGVAELSKDFIISPWQIQVGGLVQNPKTYDIDDLRTRFQQEERIYRLRCVEAWSMVIPWKGFPLASLLKEVEPMGSAKYVRFETIYSPDQMPGQSSKWYQWPYVEGLRMDEAMNDLTLLATGLYGKDLLPQNGAPVRLVVPWKYGFKSIKSIVKIDLVEDQPVSLWMAAAPNEYGFYANVNPNVDHPRWSQASERRIGESKRRETLLFNGYADEVGSLYEGMDLRVNY
jgi:sulfoxide reductase catalytic subunit YedY